MADLNDRMPLGQYNSVMAQLNSRYNLLKDGPNNPGLAQDTRNLMLNLNPTVNPGGSGTGLVRAVNTILDTKY